MSQPDPVTPHADTRNNQADSSSPPEKPAVTEQPLVTNEHDQYGNYLIRMFWRAPPHSLNEQVRRRVSVHLIPLLFCLYIVAYLDRANLGWAKLDMTRPISQGGLGFTNEIIGFAGGIFFWSYWILEIPSTLSVLKLGARWVFIRILVLWGICATLTGFIGMDPIMKFLFGWIPKLGGESLPIWGSIAYFFNELPTSAEFQLYFFRFMLGLFEGGFFPTVIFFLSNWFLQQDRAKAIALFMAAIPLSLAFGSILSEQLLRIDWFGLQGWRWIFIIQGILPFIAAIFTALYLPDRTHEARWLNTAERAWLDRELEAEHTHRQSGHGFGGWRSQLGIVLLLTLVYFGQNVCSYGLSTFMPSFFAEFMKTADDRKLDAELAALNSELATRQAELEKTVAAQSPEFLPARKALAKEYQQRQEALKAKIGTAADQQKPYVFLLTTSLYLIAFVGMLVNGWHSDLRGERIWHVAVPLFLLGVMMALVGFFFNQPMIALVIMLLGVGFFHYAHLPAFWPIPTMFLGSAAAAAAIGFINMIGNFGGSLGQIMVGKAGDTSFQTAMYLIAPAPILSALIVLAIYYFRGNAPQKN